MKNSILLQKDCITQIPLQNYQKDFTFIVNGVKYETSKLVADLLSLKISKIHFSDPTVDKYVIRTHSRGNFERVLSLVEFNQNELIDDEIPFFTEIVQELCIDKIDINIFKEKLNVNNVIDQIKKHEKLQYFFSDEFSKEIDFLSENFYKLNETQIDDLLSLSEETIERIISNENLTLKEEDQLFNLISKLWEENNGYFYFFEYVIFENISKESFEDFLRNISDFQNMSFGIWKSLLNRILNEKSEMTRKYRDLNDFPVPNNSKDLNGIVSYLQKSSKDSEEVVIKYSSIGGGDPNNLLKINEKSKGFYTANKQNSWICFEFKNHEICPKGYTIISQHHGKNRSHPRFWNIEGSNDYVNWKVIDSKDCPDLNGSFIAKTFTISNPENEKFKYLRIRQTGIAWDHSNYLHVTAMEFYGKLV